MAQVSLTISSILAIVLGIVVLIWPKGLRIVLGLWLILYGLLQFAPF